MFLKGYKNRDIQEVLEVSPGFIGQKTKLYKLLVYLGWNWQSHEGQSVIWNLLKAQQSFGGCRQKTGSSQKCKDTYSRTTMWCFTPNKAITHCLTRHGLGEKKLKNATLHKTQQCSKKTQEIITDWLERHRAEITSGKLVVFLQPEYHLLSGDWCG